MQTERSVFSVTLLPRQQVRLLLRVSDYYWSHMQVDAWDEYSFLREKGVERMRYVVAVGAVLALLAVLLLQRSKAYTLVGIGCCCHWRWSWPTWGWWLSIWCHPWCCHRQFWWQHLVYW